jgi:predicted transcriptional regulator YdeE
MFVLLTSKPMEIYQLDSDISVICVTAKSFPEGIMEAFKTLENLSLEMCDRTFFGISRPDEKGTIIYKAAVKEDHSGEGKSFGLETFTIPQGEYITETIVNWKDNMSAFGDAFDQLLKHPRMDYNYPCIEWYKSETEVMCMIKLK